MINLETVLTSLGSAIISSGTLFLLGRMWIAKKLNENLEEFKSKLVKELEIVRHELNLVNTSFRGNIEYIFEYFSIVYRYYRLCQEVSHHSMIKTLKGDMVSTKERFISKLDGVIDDWKAIEGRIRLVFPEDILVIHDKFLNSFNSIKAIVISYSKEKEKPTKELKIAFEELHNIKDEMKLFKILYRIRG